MQRSDGSIVSFRRWLAAKIGRVCPPIGCVLDSPVTECSPCCCSDRPRFAYFRSRPVASPARSSMQVQVRRTSGQSRHGWQRCDRSGVGSLFRHPCLLAVPPRRPVWGKWCFVECAVAVICSRCRPTSNPSPRCRLFEAACPGTPCVCDPPVCNGSMSRLDVAACWGGMSTPTHSAPKAARPASNRPGVAAMHVMHCNSSTSPQERETKIGSCRCGCGCGYDVLIYGVVQVREQ